MNLCMKEKNHSMFFLETAVFLPNCVNQKIEPSGTRDWRVLAFSYQTFYDTFWDKIVWLNSQFKSIKWIFFHALDFFHILLRKGLKNSQANWSHLEHATGIMLLHHKMSTPIRIQHFLVPVCKFRPDLIDIFIGFWILWWG